MRNSPNRSVLSIVNLWKSITRGSAQAVGLSADGVQGTELLESLLSLHAFFIREFHASLYLKPSFHMIADDRRIAENTASDRQ